MREFYKGEPKKILLSESQCSCGKGTTRRYILIKHFSKNMFPITGDTLRIWNDKKRCWKCKTMPLIGETWGLSLNGKERNRLYCGKCSEEVWDLLHKIT